MLLFEAGDNKRMKRFALLLLLLAVPCSLAARDYSFSMNITVSPDGSAHVTEKTVFFLENQFEHQSFEYYLSQGKTVLTDWQAFSKNIKYHLSGSVTNLRITATREYSIGFDAAAVVLEYDAAQLVKSERVGSRITRFALDSSFIALSGGKGELTLGNNMNLEVKLPRDAYAVKLAPAPSSSQANEFVWTGPISGKWELSYEREKALSDEVNEFFLRTYRDVQSSYVWFFLLLLLGAVAFKLVQSHEK